MAAPTPFSAVSYLLIDSISNADFASGTNDRVGPGAGSVGGVSAFTDDSGLEIIDNHGALGDVIAFRFTGDLAIGDKALMVTNTVTSGLLNFNAIPGSLTVAAVGADLRLSWGSGPG